jgi:hypothetical protein
MIDLDPIALAQAIIMSRPLNVRTIGFDLQTFDLLKGIQRRLESRIRRDTGNAEVLKCLIHTHPEARGVE